MGTTKTQPIERALPGLHESLLEQLLPLDRESAILDVGCGTGAWLQRLANVGFTRLSGLDRNLGDYSGPPAELASVDLDRSDPPFPGRKFDLITALEVVEHLECPGRLLDLFDRSLAPRGLVLLTTPNLESLAARFRFLFTGRVPHFDLKGDPTHVFPVIGRCLNVMLARHGLEVLSSWPFPRSGSIAFRPSITMLSRLFAFLPEPSPGDLRCVLIGRPRGPATE